MANTLDLTITEVAEKINTDLDPEMKTYVEGMPALPANISFAEFLNKFLLASRLAQVAKNNANANAATGERLNTVAAPVNGVPATDAITGITSFTQSITVSVVIPGNSNVAVPSRN